MKILLVLAAVSIVILLIWYFKRKSTQENTPKFQAAIDTVQQKISAELQPDVSELASAETEKFSVAVAEHEPVEIKQEQPLPIMAIPQVGQVEKVPEDSMLRRHYFSNLEAERLAITHPYPTDSVLRRHYESGLFWQLTPVSQKSSDETIASVEEVTSSVAVADQPVIKVIIPEDSTLKRHFLTQIEAEVENNLSPRPTDATLRRHYDSLVKSRVEAYLTTITV